MRKILIVALFVTGVIGAHAAPAPSVASVEMNGAFVSLTLQETPGSRIVLRKTAILSVAIVPRKSVAGDPMDVIVVVVTSEMREGTGSQYRFSFVEEASASKFVDDLLKALSG